MADPRRAGWTVLAGIAGAVVLGFVGAPQSLDLIFLVGLDNPDVIGEQFVVAMCGAVATAVAVLQARHWRWLLAVGAIGVLVAFLFHNPDPVGFSVDVRVPGEGSPSEFPVPLPWAAALVVATGVVLVAVLAAAQELGRSQGLRAGLAGLAGVAGYLGVSVTGGAEGAGEVVRLVVLAVAAAAIVLALVRDRGAPPATTRDRRLRLGAAVAVLCTVLPTLLVLIRGTVVYGTAVGGVAGLVLVVLALAMAARAGVAGVLAVGAVGLVLAAPVFFLLVLYDTMIGQVWYGWPIAVAGVLLGVAVAGRRLFAPVVVGVAALPAFALATEAADADHTTGAVVVWLFLALTVAAVAATVGTAAECFAAAGSLPALGALGTVAALGVHGTLNFVRVGADGAADFERVTGATGQVIAGVLMLGGAVLLIFLGRVHSRVDPSDIDQPPEIVVRS